MINYYDYVVQIFKAKKVKDYRICHLIRNLEYMSGSNFDIHIFEFSDGVIMCIFEEVELDPRLRLIKNEYLVNDRSQLDELLNSWIKKCKLYRQKHASKT